MQQENLPDNGKATFVQSSPAQPKQLLDKVALVIGDGNGSSRSLVLALAESGAHTIFVCSQTIQLAGYDLQQKVSQIGRRCLLMAGDLTDKAFAQQVMEEIKTRFGRLDIFIDSSTTEEALTADENPIFPHYALTKAALRQITSPKARGGDSD